MPLPAAWIRRPSDLSSCRLKKAYLETTALPCCLASGLRVPKRSTFRVPSNKFWHRHRQDTWSGLSATLFQDRTTGTYTLSFRSTEFGDDAAGGDWSRDGIAGADGELNAHGFAIAQVAEAEAWFRELRGQRPGAGGGLSKSLPDNAILNVAGKPIYAIELLVNRPNG